MKRLLIILLSSLLSSLCLAQTINTSRMLAGVNYQTGTTYSFQPVDTTYLVSFSNAGSVAACLSAPQSACTGVTQPYFFGKGSIFSVVNTGVGTVTITCSSCTINGSATLTLATGQGVDVYGDGMNFGAVTGASSGYGPGSSPTFTNLTVTGTCTGCGSAPLSGHGAFFFGPGITNAMDIYSATNWAQAHANLVSGVGTANTLVCYLFELEASFTISKASVIAANSVGGIIASFGIYNAATGAKLLDAGQFNSFPTGTVQTNSVNGGTSVTLPGNATYYECQAANSTSSSIQYNPGINISSSSSTSVIPSFTANYPNRVVVAGNPMAAGVLPATLGTLTLYTPSNSNGDGIVAPLYE